MRTGRGRGRILGPLPRRELARHQPALGDQRQRWRSAAHRRRRPGPDFRDDRTRRHGAAVRARVPACARGVAVGAAATGSRYERRPSVRAVRSRLSRGHTPVPDFWRRAHSASHAERDRDGSRDGSASKARLTSGVLATKSPDRIFTLGFNLLGLATLAQASSVMLVNTSIGLLVVRKFGLGPQIVGALIGIQATCALLSRFPVGSWTDRYGSRPFAFGRAPLVVLPCIAVILSLSSRAPLPIGGGGARPPPGAGLLHRRARRRVLPPRR